MKNLIVLVAVFMSVSSSVFAWEKFLTCNNGALVIDSRARSTSSGDYGGPLAYQIVVRDYGVAQYFAQNGVGTINDKGEIILGSTLLKNPYERNFTIVGTTVDQIDVTATRINGGLLLQLNGSNSHRANWFFESCN